MENCVFCKIINKEIPAYIIAENEEIIVFLSLENHPLVMPKKHIKNIYELDAKIGSEIMKSLVNTSQLIKKVLICDGVYIAQANEPAAGQDVFHIHFHVVPCWQGQKMNLRERINDGEREKTLEKIAKFL